MAWIVDPQTGALVNDTKFDTPAPVPEPEKSGFLQRTVGDTLTGFAKGALVGIPQAAVGIARLGTLGMADPLLNPISDTLDSMGERIDKKYSTQHQQQAKEVADTKGFMPTIGAYLSRPGYLLDTIAEQVPAMVGGGLAGRAAVGGTAAMKAAGAAGPEALAALGTKAGAIGEGLVTAGQNAEQVDEAIRSQTGENSTLQAKLLAGAGGVVTGGIAFGSGKLANKLGISDLDTMLAGGGRGAGAGSLAGRVAKGFLTEGVLEELPQSMQEQMWNNAALSRPLTEGVMEAGAQGLVLGGVMGGGAQMAGKRIDPAAVAHNNRMRDALAGIAVLTEPQQLDATGAPVVTKDHIDALAAIAKYAEHVEGSDVAAVKEWQAAQRAEMDKPGGTVSFDNVPGITNDASARAWAENRRNEILAREQAGQLGQTATDATMQEGFGEVAGKTYQPDVPSRSLTKQEQAQVAQLNAALAAGDMETVARLQGKLYARAPQTAQAAAAAPATTVTPAAPAEVIKKPNPKNPREWDDALLAEESGKLEATDLSDKANKVRREAARRAEQKVVYGDNDPAPDRANRAYGMASVLRSDGKSFSTAAATSVEKELAKTLPANATAKQLTDALRKIAADLNVSHPATAELAGTYADALQNRQGAPNVQATHVDQGAGRKPATGEATTPDSKGNPRPVTKRDAPPESVEKTTEEVNSMTIPYDTVSFDEKTKQKTHSSGQSDIIDLAGRKIVMRSVNGVMVPFYLSTGHGGKKDVTAGKWYPFFGLGVDGWMNKTGGKQMMDHYGSAELKAVADQLNATIGDIRTDDTIPKAGATGAHVDFINQHMNPTENGTADSAKNLHANILDVLSRITAGSTATEVEAPLPKVGDRVVTSHNKHGTVTEVTAKGGVHVTLDDGTKITHTAKTIADGQLRVATISEQKATPAPEAKSAPKQEVEPTAEDWDKAYAAVKDLADKLGLVLPKTAASSPTQAATTLKGLAEKIEKVKDEGARTQMRALVAKARDAATVEMARRKTQFAADLKAKDEKAAADATAALQQEAKKAREAMTPSELWDDIRGDKQLPGDRYVPTWAELKQFMADIKEFSKQLPEVLKEQKALTKEVAKARTAMNKAKKSLNTVNDQITKLKGKLATAEATGKGDIEALQAGIDLLTEDAKGHTTTYEQLSDRVAELDQQLHELTAKVETVEGAKQQIASLEAVLAKFQKDGLARSESYGLGDLVADVANSRLAPYLAKIREMQKDDSTASGKKATYELNKETMLELADIFYEKGSLTKAQQEQFMQKYAATRKNNGKGDDFATAMQYVQVNYLYHTGGVGTSPGIKVALEATNGTQRFAEVLDVVAKLSDNEALRALALSLKSLVGNVNVVYEDTPMPVNVGEGKTAFRRGVYNASSNTLTIYAGGENAHTVLHEAVHAATAANIERVGKLVGNARTQADVQAVKGYRELVSLFSALKAMPEFAGEYAFKNLHEFVAEVYTNQRLQLKMAMVQAPQGLFDKAVAKLGSLMDAFVHAIQGVLGLKPGSRDALSRAIELTEGLFSAKTSPATGDFDSLSSPVAALTTLATKLPAMTQITDNWVEKTKWEDLKASARKVWLGLVSSDYIKDMVTNSPGLGKVAEAIGSWFETDRLKTQVKNLISKDVYDGFIRKMELALNATGDYTKYNELMGELAGEASRIGFDLTKNFDQNVAAQAKGQPKLDPAMRQEINRLHQKFTALQNSTDPKLKAVAALILEGEKVNRKLYTMQMASLARNILDSHATGPSSAAAAQLLAEYDKKLDILMDTKGLTNSNDTKHLDALAATLHDNLVALFTVFDGANTSLTKGDLHDDMKSIQGIYAKAWAAPYMHLGRHGMQHIAFNVSDTSPQTVAKLNQILGGHGFVLGPFAKGSSEVFLRVDSLTEMNQIHAKLLATKGLIAEKDGKQLLRAGELSDVGVDNMAGVSKAMEALRKRMEDRFNSKKGDGKLPAAQKAAFDEMKAMLNQEFLDMLEINSAKQVNQVRKGVVGYSADYMQNFAKRAQWSDASIANQYTTRGYTKAFRDMQQTVNDLQGSNPMQASKGQNIVDELATRFSNSLKPNTNPIINKLSVFGHNFYLALSPAYTIGNLLQPYMLTLPLLGGRHGFVKSSKVMASATADTFSLISKAVKTGWTEGGWRGLLDAKLNLEGTNLKQDELEFLQHLIRSGIVDATQSHELGRLAKGESSSSATAAKVMSAFNHYSEVTNRLSAGLAAYRLADKMKVEDRRQYAIDIVRRTQYDYADHNKARFIGRHGVLGVTTPLFMQFQTFAFFTMENYIRMFKDGFMGDLSATEKAEARSALVGTLTATALVAGTMGLPFATVLAAAANGAGGGDDKDARAKYRDWLASMLGKRGAEMVAKGPISRSLGIDLTGSLGHQDLFPGSRWMADRRPWDDKVKDMSKSMLGPAVNAGFDIYSGVEKVKDGDIMGGIKSILPRFLKGPAEAVKTAQEGAFVNKAGTTLPMPVTSWDYIDMALGFNPSKKAEQSEANFYYQSEMAQRKQDKKLAQKRALQAQQEGNLDEMNEILTEFNTNHQLDQITNLGAVLRAQARGQAAAAYSGTGIIDGNKKHWPTMNEYGAYNTGVE